MGGDTADGAEVGAAGVSPATGGLDGDDTGGDTVAEGAAVDEVTAAGGPVAGRVPGVVTASALSAAGGGAAPGGRKRRRSAISAEAAEAANEESVSSADPDEPKRARGSQRSGSTQRSSLSQRSGSSRRSGRSRSSRASEQSAAYGESDSAEDSAASEHSDSPGRTGLPGRTGSPEQSASSKGSESPGRSESPEQVARDTVYRLLAARARSRSELRQALLRKEIDEDVADDVLQKFADAGLIDDAAFAETWVHARQRNKGLGRRALGFELRRKGVDETLVEAALSTMDEDVEVERARELVRRKLRSLGSADYTAKMRRLVGMLARKGYSEGLAYRVAKEELERSGSNSEDAAADGHPPDDF